MRPLVQFFLLGAVLFAADRLWWSRAEPVVIHAASEEAVEDELLYREIGRANV